MRAGTLRHKIIFQSKQVTRDAMGGEQIAWIDEAVLPASAEPLNGREFHAAQQQQSEIELRFRIRFYFGVVPQWRVSWEDRLYDIVAIIDMGGRHIEQHLMCRTQKPGTEGTLDD